MIHKWKFIRRKTLLTHPRMTIVEDKVLLPNNKQVSYIREVPCKNHGVIVIALDTDGRLLLQKEYSYPPDEVLYQLPGGAAEENEDIAEAANRELSEESGYRARKTRVIGSFYRDNRRSNRKLFVVLCEDLMPQKKTEDEEEFIESEWVELSEVKRLIGDGKIENITLLAAFVIFDSLSMS